MNDLMVQDAANVRRTNDGRASVYDLLKAAGAKDQRKVFARFKISDPDFIAQHISMHKFDGSGQRLTPVIHEEKEGLLLSHFLKVAGEDIPSFVKQYGRLPRRLKGTEERFGDELQKIAGQMPEEVKMVRQFPCGNFRIDFFFPDALLAIEFDEPHHRRQETEDAARQEYIQRKLDCEFIRVPQQLGMREKTSTALGIIAYAAVRAEVMSIKNALPDFMHDELMAELPALRRKYTGALPHPRDGLLTVSI